MDIYTLKVTKDDDNKQIKYFLAERLSVSSHMLSSLKRTSSIKLNGECSIVTQRLRKGDVVTVELKEEAPSCNIVPVNMPLDIIYEDNDILAVCKPKDMPVHPSIGNYDNTLANAVMYYYRGRDFVFRAINRLDRDTTGIVLIAKNRICANIMSGLSKDGKIKKTYDCVLDGVPDKKRGLICAPIARERDSVIKRCVRDDGKYALTEYEITEEQDGISLARVRLHTGRTHQIRVHFSHIGTPLLYDYLYGREKEGKSFYLHCSEVEFPHPFAGESLFISKERGFSLESIVKT